MSDTCVNVIHANVDFGRGRDRVYVRQMIDWGADALLLCEAKTFDIDDCLPKGWTGFQKGRIGSGEAGCAIAIKDSVFKPKKFKLVPVAKPFIRGRRIGMQVRYMAMLRVDVRGAREPLTLGEVHLPPHRFRALQPGAEKRIRETLSRKGGRYILGSDTNQPIGEFARDIGNQARAHGRRIDGLFTPFPARKVVVRPWGISNKLTDHPAIQGVFEV